MICIDIGNKYTTIYDGKNTLTKLTTIQFQQHNRVEIGLDRSVKNVVYDMVVLLGTKYQDQQFTRYAKFYSYDFWRNQWGKIDVGVPAYQGISPKSKCFIIQTLLALFLKKLLLQYKQSYLPSTTTLPQLLSSHKFYILTSSTTDHPTRYSLKQCLQIAGIESPIFLNCSHSLLCSFYARDRKELKDAEDICVVQFGDRGAAVGVYRMQGSEEKIIDVVQCGSVHVGGFHLTKLLAQYIIECIKEEKGIDISRHTSYMSLLHSQCQSSKIHTTSSSQAQSHIRIPNLPDDSTFGKIISQKLLTQIIDKDVNKVITIIRNMLTKYKKVKEILVFGGSSVVGGFLEKVRDVGKEKVVRRLGREDICQGVFRGVHDDIVVFDVSDAEYQVTGEEGFKRKLMGVGENIPDRRNEKIKFPAGELQFNFRVSENNKKIAHFILDSRPSQPEFFLNFQIDRNKLIWLYVKTDKGKINLIPNFEAINPENLFKQAQRLKQYQN